MTMSDAAEATVSPDTESPSVDPARDRARRRRRLRKKIATWTKRAVLVLIAVTAVAAAVLAFMPDPVPVDTATADRGAFKVTVREDGKTRMVNRYIVAAPISGTMPRVHLREGDRVEEGAVLFRIAPTPPPLLDDRTRANARAQVSAAQAGKRQADAQIARAQAGYEQAESNLERERGLSESGVSSAQQLELAEYALRAAKQELAAAKFGAKVAAEQVAAAKTALGYVGKKPGPSDELEVISPTAGVVLRVLRQDAGPIQIGAPLLELGDPNSIEVVADVLTRDAVQINEGARVSIDRWGGDIPLAGHVHRVEPAAFTRISALGVEEQRVNVVVHFDHAGPDLPALGDGYRVEVDIAIWEGTDVLTIPTSAVFRRGAEWAVFLLNNGKATDTRVKLGRRTAARTEIIEGLGEGDTVIVHPSDRVSDGTEVEKRARKR
jgi:HlyD family secretion protein